MDGRQRIIALTQALADPLRYEMLRELMGGPMTVSELAALTGATQPNISNHLAVLRTRGLARATREGRRMLYEIRDPAVAGLIEALAAVADAPETPARERVTPPLARARFCYDHLAGEVGVALFEALVARDALAPAPTEQVGRAGPSAAVTLGPAGEAIFAGLGVPIRGCAARETTFCLCLCGLDRAAPASGWSAGRGAGRGGGGAWLGGAASRLSRDTRHGCGLAGVS